MTIAQRRNRLTTHFSESIPVVKRRISVNPLLAVRRYIRYTRYAGTHRPIAVRSLQPEQAPFSPHPPDSFVTEINHSVPLFVHLKTENTECLTVSTAEYFDPRFGRRPVHCRNLSHFSTNQLFNARQNKQPHFYHRSYSTNQAHSLYQTLRHLPSTCCQV